MQKQFKLRANSRVGISDKDANVYGQHILSLMKKKKASIVKPEELVKDAKQKNTPYHGYFQWDNTKAGAEYRKEQARDLLRNIVEVEIVSDKKQDRQVEVRSFHVVSENNERGYSPLEHVLSSKDLTNQVLERALKEAKSWSARYKIYSELADIRKKIDEVAVKLIK